MAVVQQFVGFSCPSSRGLFFNQLLHIHFILIFLMLLMALMIVLRFVFICLNFLKIVSGSNPRALTLGDVWIEVPQLGLPRYQRRKFGVKFLVVTLIFPA